MHSEILKQRILAFDTCSDALSREEKTNLRNHRRGAFKAWLRDRMGNAALFRAVVKHGFFDTRSLSEFMVAYHVMQDRGNLHPTVETSPTERERRRAEALKARMNVSRARRLAVLYRPLLPYEQDLVYKLEFGDLEKIRQQADKAYGHGAEVSRMTTMDAVLHRVSGNELDNCFRRTSI